MASGFHTISRPKTREQGSDNLLPSLAFFPVHPTGCCLRACAAVTQHRELGGELPLFARPSSLRATVCREEEKASPGSSWAVLSSCFRGWYLSAHLLRGCSTLSIHPFRADVALLIRTVMWGLIFHPSNVFTPYPYYYGSFELF